MTIQNPWWVCLGVVALALSCSSPRQPAAVPAQPTAETMPTPVPPARGATTEPGDEPGPGSQPSDAKDPSPAPTADEHGSRCTPACAPPERCVLYAGIAGPKVPLYTCGIPCSEPNQDCPQGLACKTIADGPRLCEPR